MQTKLQLNHGQIEKTFTFDRGVPFWKAMMVVSEYITHHVPASDRADIRLNILARAKFDQAEADFVPSEKALAISAAVGALAFNVLLN